MGSPWEIQLFDSLPSYGEIENAIGALLDDFDATYSRFSSLSLVTHLSQTPGIHTVPADLVSMLREYIKMHDISDSKINPLVGATIEDLGYDSNYSLKAKETIRTVPFLHDSLTIHDDVTLEIKTPVLIDLGAIGKGYSVGLVRDYLDKQGFTNYLINGSGDILHRGSKSITVGLENPFNVKEAIGTIQLQNSALASSGSSRRKWGNIHHIIDPQTLVSPHDIVGTWVIMEDPALADLLATALFLVHPDILHQHYAFEWLIVDKGHQSTFSKGFIADLF